MTRKMNGSAIAVRKPVNIPIKMPANKPPALFTATKKPHKKDTGESKNAIL